MAMSKMGRASVSETRRMSEPVCPVECSNADEPVCRIFLWKCSQQKQGHTTNVGAQLIQHPDLGTIYRPAKNSHRIGEILSTQQNMNKKSFFKSLSRWLNFEHIR